MTKTELDVLAPAKVNLYLGVLGKRSDGYHEIVSVMQKLDLADQLHLCLEGPGITLHCPASPLPEDSANLAWKAARVFFDQTGIRDDLRITLHKKIPVAAGLGGGSSDAAAVLRGLNTLCRAGLSEDSLLALASGLGADCPFFVSDMNTALALGTGTELRPIVGPKDYWLVLVNPGIAVSTRWVYENLLLTTDQNPYKLSGYSQEAKCAGALVARVFSHDSTAPPLFNDLEKVTVGKHPIIRTIKDKLRDDGAFVSLMSGSGPTVFGAFREFEQAAESCENFRKLYPEVYVVSPLS
jgi:4-diphosphocytidyl-2-C-methyl-D-erythritol kinase